jgi:hypothetical protein
MCSAGLRLYSHDRSKAAQTNNAQAIAIAAFQRILITALDCL